MREMGSDEAKTKTLTVSRGEPCPNRNRPIVFLCNQHKLAHSHSFIMNAWKICLGEPHCLKNTFTLQEGSLLLGAAQDCDIISSADGVAPKHTEFLVRFGKLQIRNVNPSPKTRLNGARVHKRVDVTCPASIKIGSLQITVEEVISEHQIEPTSDSRVTGPSNYPEIRHHCLLIPRIS